MADDQELPGIATLDAALAAGDLAAARRELVTLTPQEGVRQARARSRLSINRRCGSCLVSFSARSYASIASPALPSRRHSSARAEWATA